MCVKLALLIAAIALLIWVSPYFAFVILGIFVWIGIDVAIGLSQKARPSLPPKDRPVHETKHHINDVLWLLENRDMTNPEINFTLSDLTEEDFIEVLEPYVNYIHARYDCLDFRATCLYRFYVAGNDLFDEISPSGKVRALLEDTFLGMKFWLTEKGHDSVCYFSENHEITFFALAYLIGRLFPDRVFTSDGRTGAEKAAEARERAITWLELRGKYGFSEFYSHNYLPIDFASLSLFLVYCDHADAELVTKIKGALDILCLDYAHSYHFGTIIGAQGRAYARNNINCAFRENTSDLVIDAIWNDTKKFGGIYYHKPSQLGMFQRMMNLKDENGEPYYTVPAAIKAIGTDMTPARIRTSFGLDLSEIDNQGLLGSSDRQIMFQFGMVALSNPEIINNSFDFVNEYSLIRNEFFSPFKYFNISLLRFLGVFPLISRGLKIYPNGVAIERSNVYIYKTEDYKLSTLIDYKPGSAGAQQTTMALLLPGGVTVFTHHPLKDKTFNSAPGFWGGYGAAPHAVQHENVCMLLHRIPKMIVFSPAPMLPYTHTYLPEQLLDEVRVEGRYAFARKGKTLFALIGATDFEYLPYNAEKAAVTEGLLSDETKRFELVQRGREQFTIYELSTSDKESFEDFISRVKANAVSFDGKNLAYHSADKDYALTYDRDFTVNGEVQETQFKRYDSPYVQTEYLGEDIVITAGGHTHHINVREGVRESK
ncbi:MAG: hypothetical protein J5765_02965 [Clostridia bacterium]|nr:hypothetical protein [Clostridia bacterium]